MNLFSGLSAGSVPQWGTFLVALSMLITLLITVIRHLPALVEALNARVLARNERLRDQASEDRTALESWRELKEEVSRELEECQKGRAADTAMRKRLDDENFRLRVVLTLLLDEVGRLDPESQIVLKAKAILTLPTANGVEPPDLERVRLEELLKHIP